MNWCKVAGWGLQLFGSISVMGFIDTAFPGLGFWSQVVMAVFLVILPISAGERLMCRDA